VLVLRGPGEELDEPERRAVTEAEIEHAFRFLYERAKLACEPAGAVATAASRGASDVARTRPAAASGAISDTLIMPP